MKTYSIIITPEAEKDIDDIWLYIAVNDLPGKATCLSEQLERKCYTLSYIPERGRCVPEFKNLGIFDLYEIFHGPYRIMYKIINARVIIYRIFDGRRELKELLLTSVSNSSAFEFS